MVCNVAADLRLSQRKAAALMIELERAGYVEPDPMLVSSQRDRGDPNMHYRPTHLGLAVMKARFSRPLTRKRANAIVEDVITRANDAEQRKFAYRLVEVHLFGSAANPASEAIGDVDIALSVAPRAERARGYTPRFKPILE